MKTYDAVKYMEKIFADYWNKQLKYYCIYPNQIGKTPSTNDIFAKFDIVHMSADRATLNGLSKTKYRQQGFINIEVFVPVNTNMETAYELTQNILNLYRRPPHDCQINFTSFDFSEGTLRYKDFCKINIYINFDYDYHF